MNTRISNSLMLVDGKWEGAADGRLIEVQNPAKRTIIGEVPRAGAAEVDRAVRAAAKAFESWKLVQPRERGRLLMKIADAMDAESEAIGRLIATETGNALRTQSRPEAKGAADLLRYFGGLASEVKGETVPLGEHVLSYTRREPIGVVGAIIPWNSPVVLGAMKIAMSLAAGNTLVLKAAEDAPLGVLKMAELCAQHLPAGVLNVVTGYGEEAGAALLQHPLVRKFSFTGSTEVGKLVMHAAADRIVPVSLELGGKSPCIVFPDATSDAVVDGVATAMRFTRQGQSCTAGSRLFLHRSIFDDFLSRLKDRLAKLKIGDPLDEATDMGAIINKKQFDRVCGYIRDGLAQKDARLVMGGLPPKEGPLAEGFFVEPTVFAEVKNDWRIAREEIFGPVASVIRAKDYDEALAIANDTEFGLSAGICTTSLKHASHFRRNSEAGMVMVNLPTAGVDYHVPFGGRKASSYGPREQGAYAREFYTTVKTSYTLAG